MHGDWAAIDDDGLWYILGRSDDTIKVAGKRVGPAEVESVLVQPSGSDPGRPRSASRSQSKGEEIVCFCMLAPGSVPSEALRTELMERLIAQLGKPLKPREVKFATALPRTRNAKIMHRVHPGGLPGRRPGRLIVAGRPAAVDAIRNAI